jgi:hypothetical protein
MSKTSAFALIISLAALGACGAPPEPVTPPGTGTATPAVTDAPATTGAPAATTAPAATGAPVATAAPATTGAPVAPPGQAWDDTMSKDQKVAFMKAMITPRMGKVFQGADAKRYGEFGCKTCHGPAFALPKAFLPKLKLKDGKLTAFAEKPEISKFMAEKVTPEMAAAMGAQPYDPAKHTGFGCGGCHTIETK